MTVAANSNPMTLANAQRVADAIVAEFAPGCERIEIAGSIRRKKEIVNDIEIVAIPKLTTDLFGVPDGGTLLAPIIAKHVEGGRLERIKGGDKYQQYHVVKSRCKLDLFLADAETWGCIFTIRTGSANFSHQLVTPQSQNGYCPNGMRFQGGRLLRNGAAIPTPEEADVFRELGLARVEPKDRK